MAGTKRDWQQMTFECATQSIQTIDIRIIAAADRLSHFELISEYFIQNSMDDDVSIFDSIVDEGNNSINLFMKLSICLTNRELMACSCSHEKKISTHILKVLIAVIPCILFMELIILCFHRLECFHHPNVYVFFLPLTKEVVVYISLDIFRLNELNHMRCHYVSPALFVFVYFIKCNHL